MATTTTETKRRSSFKNLFSLFKANKSEKSLPQPESAPPASFQLSYTPTTSPSPSNSSASSFEFEDSTTTADTTPSNSRTSVVSKPSDASVTTISSGSSGGTTSSTSSAATTISSTSTSETPTTKSLPIQPRPKSLINPSAGCPYLLPPNPPTSPILHTRAPQPIHRHPSLGRFLPRGYRSSPDLSALDLENSSDAELPISSSAPTSRPGSRPTSSHEASPAPLGLQKTTGKKKSKSNKRADLEAHTSYSPQERMEHRSILGADPAGLGFYLYPKPQKGRPVSMGAVGAGGYPSFGPVGAGGYPSFGLPPPPQQQQYSIGNMGRGRDSGRRAWREQKGRSYQRTIATSCIVEEEGELRLEGEQQDTREGEERVPTVPQLKVQSFEMPSIDSLLEKETGVQIPAMVTA
ncbi:hypothetical protein FPQ18DRAFT_122844 [Pyronema domesticum]|nr:hypothetical protein FPQ18DRAFT_122844 [Pyronema domesticum]